jgi:hypothetical protein
MLPIAHRELEPWLTDGHVLFWQHLRKNKEFFMKKRAASGSTPAKNSATAAA